MEQIAKEMPNVEQQDSKAKQAAETAAEAMRKLPTSARMYFQGFLNGLQAAEETKKAG
jgi:hypothetical protein